MRKKGIGRFYRFLPLAALVAGLFVGGTVLANTSDSANYQATDMQFSSGSSLESCAGDYCAQATIGSLGANASSNDSTASFGDITSTDPMLEVIVDPGESNLGVLTTEQTASKTAHIRVRTYLSNGYILQITGDPPKYANHTMNAPSSLTASAPGTEQFALNATVNGAIPGSADPVQVPSNEFAFGIVEDDYKVSNQYKYISGDVVARSLAASGRTDYTISIIVNISNQTPAGHYEGEFAAVVVPLF